MGQYSQASPGRQAERASNTKSVDRQAGYAPAGPTGMDSGARQPATSPPVGLSVGNVLRLQRAIGNQAVGSLLTPRESGPRQGMGTATATETAIHRKLVLDGKERAKPEDAQADLGADFAKMQATVQELISLPGAAVTVTTAELKEVHAFRTEQKIPGSRAAKVAVLQLLSGGAWTHTGTVGQRNFQRLQSVFASPDALKNLKQLGEFLAANPNVGGNLRAAGVGWTLSSEHQFINDFGGGAVIEDRVHIANWVLSEKDQGFMRMVVHEAGHATFQRMLLTGQNWTEAANKGEKAPDDKALVEDGKKFYDAWQVLRQKPQFFFITDMPGDSDEAKGAGRGGYLAKQFTEFCAESFMHLALEKSALQSHVDRLPERESEIKGAWQSALGVLLKYESQILGKEGAGGKETLASHRRTQQFVAVLQKLKDGLKGPNLEVVNIDAVKSALEAVRQAWHGLTPTERAQHRLDALKTLDEYIMRVQRRRPAQANLGSELGFANL